MKNLHLTLKIRNNQLRERREQLRLTIAELSLTIGVAKATYGALESMRLHPYTSKIMFVCRIPDCSSPASAREHHLCSEHRNQHPSAFPLKRAAKNWTKTVLKIAEFYDSDPIELFPDVITQISTSTFTKTVDAGEISPYLLSTNEERRQLGPDENIEREERRLAVRKAMQILTPRENFVLRGRLGLDNAEPMTFDEIGQELEVTGSAIQAVEKKALRKLRCRKNLIR